MPRDLKPIQELLDGDTYVYGYMQTSQALEVALEVAQRFLPTIGALFKDGSLMDQDVNNMDFRALAVGLAGALDPQALTRLIRTLCAYVQVSNGVGVLEGQVFENHFAGRPGLALKVAAKSFEVSCKDFFGSAVALAGMLKKTASPPTIPAQ